MLHDMYLFSNRYPDRVVEQICSHCNYGCESCEQVYRQEPVLLAVGGDQVDQHCDVQLFYQDVGAGCVCTGNITDPSARRRGAAYNVRRRRHRG